MWVILKELRYPQFSSCPFHNVSWRGKGIMWHCQYMHWTICRFGSSCGLRRISRIGQKSQIKQKNFRGQVYSERSVVCNHVNRYQQILLNRIWYSSHFLLLQISYLKLNTFIFDMQNIIHLRLGFIFCCFTLLIMSVVTFKEPEMNGTQYTWIGVSSTNVTFRKVVLKIKCSLYDIH